MNAVKVCCGSAHVKGTARKYPYYIAQVFEPQPRKDGIVTFRSTGRVVGPFRSQEKAEREGRALAEREHAEFVPGYGSLHGKPVPGKYLAPVLAD